MQFRARDKILILGASECGKSYLGRQIQSLYKHKIIIDAADEYNDTTVYTIFSDLTKFAEYLNQINFDRPKEFSIVFKFYDGIEDEIKTDIFNRICQMVWSFKGVLFVVEETHEFCTPHKMPNWFALLEKKGRHREIGVLKVTQRPADIHKGILSECQHIFIGRLQATNDIDYVSNFIDSKFNLRTLQDRNFFYYSKDQKKLITTESNRSGKKSKK